MSAFFKDGFLFLIYLALRATVNYSLLQFDKYSGRFYVNVARKD